MNHNVSLLSRLFGRSRSAVVTQAFSHAIGQPLMVEPMMGQALIGAYLHGAVDSRPPTVTMEEVAGTNGGEPFARQGKVAVLNVSGGLVNRFEPGLCDPGPLSYEALHAAFDAALSDDSVDAIVMRIESPGGMASGAFDLSDAIFAARGKKPIVAAIDDYAYSAAYAIAAAADEIWITRTGGAGSVGVRAFHGDQSAFNNKQGIKITEIIAGDHKADFSPHAPLSDAAMARLQSEVNALHRMFVGAVAKYRGMDADAVLATQALTYMGADAVAVGFADRIGTFRELMGEIAGKIGAGHNGDDVVPQAASAVNSQAAALAEAAPVQTAAPDGRDTVANAIAGADLFAPLAVALLRRNDVTAETVQARIAEAQEIDDACAAAGMRDYAVDYVAKGVAIQIVRDQLLAAKASGVQELINTPPATVGGSDASGAWGSTIRKFGGN